MERGKIPMVVFDRLESLEKLENGDFSQLDVESFDDEDKCTDKTHQCRKEKIPFFSFDGLTLDYSFYYFRGLTFKKTVKTTGEVLDFDFYGNDKPFNMEDIKKDLEKLMKMLNTKISSKLETGKIAKQGLVFSFAALEQRSHGVRIDFKGG